MSDSSNITIEIVQSIDEIKAEDWDACANHGHHPYNPFLSHGFLRALEESGSATAQTGWGPCHVLAKNEREEILGVVPMYLKSHSQGEYVFDHNWAGAYQRAGGDYYPKLQVSVPFTPATGHRLLTRDHDCAQITEKALLQGTIEAARLTNASSVHFTFLPKEQWERLGSYGLLQRTDQQFHWLNQNYTTFQDFLESLTSRKRKNLRKERETALSHGITIERLTGDDIKPHHWDAFFNFYIDTGARKWGRPYLTRSFFDIIGAEMAKDILLIMCAREGRYIAGALNFIGGDTLFGRNWGCLEDHKFLHFETCYYQAIEFAIERGLSKVEAGAQGAHKLARGYVPTLTYSAHYIVDPRFREAIDDYLERERKAVDEEVEYLADHIPFRQSSPSTDDEKQ